jgi:hypothetical protein
MAGISLLFVVPSKKEGVLAFIQKTRGKERQPELSEPGELSGNKEKYVDKKKEDLDVLWDI